MLEHTGVAAVSVARGCIGNPWIFRQARELMAGRPPRRPTIGEQRGALLEHFRLAVVLHGERLASRTMRKFGIRFAAHHREAEVVRKAFIACDSVETWKAVIDAHYPVSDRDEPAGLAIGPGATGAETSDAETSTRAD
jgi:tRNA-dihydrouridine synthase